jgi:diguanylate cyclase (GGDEF)-like protein
LKDQSLTFFGFALLSDSRGIIQKVIQNYTGVKKLKIGQSLDQFVDVNSRSKLLNFLVELNGKGFAKNWEIDFINDGRLVAIQLAGISSDNGLMIVGTRTSLEMMVLLDDLVKISSSYDKPLLSKLIKEVQITTFSVDSDVSIYSELSSMNNELVSLQRELAKKNAELEQLYQVVQKQAITDPLTGMYNRRGFYEIVEREIIRAKRYNHPLSLIAFDIDHLKKINDKYGHPFGDQVFMEITARCIKEFRKTDIISRFGGDEFLILLPETELENAIALAERFRTCINKPMIIGSVSMICSISLGVVKMTDNIVDIDELFVTADLALYHAKESGRNRVFKV